MKINKRLVVVTGGAGYIGSQIANNLIAEDYHPLIIDIKPRNLWPTSIKNYSGESLNICNSQKLTNIFKYYRPYAIIHAAALCSVKESQQKPLNYYKTNSFGTVCVLEAMRASKCNKIIFSSSCTVYGNSKSNTYTDNDRNAPLNVYSQTKIQAESNIRSWKNFYDINYVILRYFNVGGATESSGEKKSARTKLIPTIIRVYKRKQQKLILNGTTLTTIDGTAVRDYVHVNDVAQANIDALSYIERNKSSSVFNIGSGTGHSNLQVVREFEKLFNCQIPLIRKDSGPEEITESISNITETQKKLQWQPKISDLTTILLSSYNWYQTHPDYL